ncbi:MAG: nucleotidyltransferase, partial [Bacilli bacterium]
MDVIGIICEYNPFHNGHIYHTEKIKELYPDSIIILILNGYFLERGEISILTKEDKTKIALLHNVDLVVELPFIYGTQSADTFARVSLKILNELKIERLVFGSESNDIKGITEIALFQLNDETFNEKVTKYLSEGLNYPTALAKALNKKNFSYLPNDLLGISYIKAIRKDNLKIDAITIKRTNDYKDIKSNSTIISATNIRNKIKNKEDITSYLPENSINNLVNVNYDKYFLLLKYKINTDLSLDKYLDVDEGIEYRLKKYINESKDIFEFVELIKTKRYTYNKINRMLIHILIGLTKSDNINSKLDYIKVLGFNKEGQKYLKEIKKNMNITTSVNIDSLIYKYELKASIIYDLINDTNTIEFEERKKPIMNGFFICYLIFVSSS